MKKKIVIVGAGYAGIIAAKKLAKSVKKLKKSSEIEITIIDKNPFHTMLTELHEVAAWRVEEDSIKISLERVFAGRAVNVVMDTIKSIDYSAKSVVGEKTSYSYDYLVLASGSQPIFFGVSGAKENAFTLWSYEDAVELREHFMNMFRMAACETNEAKKRKLLTFFVVGCGFTGVEMAGEIAEMVPSLCDRFEIDPSYVTMYDVDMLDRVCTILPTKLSDKVQRRLEKMGVKVKLKTNIVAVGEDYVEIVENGKTVRIDTCTAIWTAGVEGSDIAKGAQEIGGMARGRVQTDEFLRSQNDKSVYIAGDNIMYIPKGEDKPVPQMVENCEASAEIIAHNLMCDITKTGEMEDYNPKFHGVMVCIGGRYGVANVGMPGKFFSLASFFAMFTKHFINIIYFIQVLGWNKVFAYMKHEFFTIRNCRSFVGGHFSNRSPSFFLVPLRVFIGFYWLFEGLKKVGEGWLQSPKLTGFFTGANAYYDSILKVAAGGVADATAAASGAATTAAAGGAEAVAAASGAATTGGVEAVAAASGAVAGAAQSVGELVFKLDIFNWVRIMLVNSGEYALKIQVALVDFMVNNTVLPSDTTQMIFQIVIVFAEILLGLALMGGLFTTVAATVSLGLQLMFLTSTGLYMSSWWMIFAGIAMLFGAGRAFSLDYYVMPWLKKWWKKVRFAKKWYLYHD